MPRRTLLIILVAIVAGGTLAAWALRHHRARTTPTSAPVESPAPVGSTGRADVVLDTRRQQLIGVRTVVARRTTMAPQIRAAGTIAYDETRQAEISTRVDGWIRDLHADYTGQTVRRGDPLFTLYSPDLIATENEYLLALQGHINPGRDLDDQVGHYADRLVDAARERLLRLDMSADDIAALERTGRASEVLTFRSPVSGVIVEKAALRGMHVSAGQMLYRVVDLSSVWAEAEVNESDLASMRVGMPARVVVDAYPDQAFDGRVSYIYPTVSEQTRTARVRLALPNSRGLLKPNMLATISLDTAASDALVVPSDAVVDTGTEHLVFVAEGDGHFSPRNVKLGRRSPGESEIVSGLTEGDVVAASATFFLDSESQLRSALQDYEPTSAENGAPARQTESRVQVTFRSEPDPPKVGDATFVVTVTEHGQPIADAAVKVVLLMAAMPSMNMPAMRAEAALVPVGNGTYRGTGQVLMAGRWDVTVTATKAGQSIGVGQFALLAQ